MNVQNAAFGLSSAWMAPVCGCHLPLPKGKSTNKAVSQAMYDSSFLFFLKNLTHIKECPLRNKTPAGLK